MTFADWFKNFRARLGLTQAQLADRSGVPHVKRSYSTVCKCRLISTESNENKPKNHHRIRRRVGIRSRLYFNPTTGRRCRKCLEHVVDRSFRGINLRNLTDKKLKTRNKKARLHGRIGVRRE